MAEVTITSNADEAHAWLDRVVDSFDFARPGVEGSLGRDLAVAAAEGMVERSIVDQTERTGSPFLANEPIYARWKAAKYDAHQPNVRTGQMLSLQSMLGDVDISPEDVALRYGTGQPPASAFSGVALSESDRSITDIEKAFFASEDRPFYGLDDSIDETLQAVAQEALDRLVEEA